MTAAFATITRKKVGFLVAGTQKGGTTALDLYLRHHPEIGMPDEKELHFFDEESFFQSPRPPYRRYHRPFVGVMTRKLWGETTPAYMYWEPAPARIQAYNPSMKFILVLRNPIERAYSHWNMERDKKTESLPFWEALQAELGRAQALLPLPDRTFSYIARGRYAEQLERLWRHFPREQVLVFKSEELRDEPQKTLDRVCQFLRVARLPGVEKADVHSRTYESGMGARERAHLKTIFTPEIKRLEELLGWDCRAWLAD